MHLLRLASRFAIGGALAALALTASLPALAADDAPATATAATDATAAATTITGTVRSAAGAAVPGATVTANGPARVSTVTDGGGDFTLTVPPGIYRVTVAKAGYDTVSTSDIAILVGQSVPLTVAISERTLSSLRTIGSVSASAHGASSINVGAANQGYVSGQSFQLLANPQVNDVLQRIPDVVVEKLGTQADTAIVVGGLQPYETQVLIDGHPLALGQFGVWLSQYFPSYMLGGVETQTGPGNTTPFANIAVGGTVNLQTPDFTKKSTAEATLGIDSYGSQYSNLLVTGSAGKFDYVAAAGYAGSNGPYFGKRECDAFTSNGAANTPASEAIIAFCGDFSGSLWNRAQNYKIRYDFSPTTSFDIGLLDSTGGFSPQGSAWGASYGPTKIVQCLPGTSECTNPADANLIGSTVNGTYWFPGTNIWNTQQLYTGQFRTSLNQTTFLVRPYLGAIQPETYDGRGEGGYPAFFSPPGAVPSLGNGVPIPSAGLTNPNAFESQSCPTGTIFSFTQINSPKNTINTVNGQEECYQYPYSTYETDKLYGSTQSIVQPIEAGNGFLDLTYDFHGQSTFAFANAPANVQVPLSATRFSTFSLTGSVQPTEKLAAKFGLYNTDWTINGEQPKLDASGNPIGTQGLDRTVSRFDPHLAVVYRADTNTSLRLSAGTSETFPFIGDVSGPAAIQPPAFLYSAGIVTEKNANLQPEYSQAIGVGADHRFSNGSVLSLDLESTVVHNVFQQLTTQETVPLNGVPSILGVFKPINVARLQAQIATLKYRYAPLRGFGFNLAVAADSSILGGIPASAYNSTPSLPSNGVQVCGNAQFTPGLATCIPYLKGYGQFTYTFRDGTFTALGVDYEGKNNQYYQPPFAILDFQFSKPVRQDLDLNLSIENLLNTNSYNYLAAPNLGVPAVGDVSSNGTTIQQASFPTYRIPAATRTLRVALRAHVGR